MKSKIKSKMDLDDLVFSMSKEEMIEIISKSQKTFLDPILDVKFLSDSVDSLIEDIEVYKLKIDENQVLELQPKLNKLINLICQK